MFPLIPYNLFSIKLPEGWFQEENLIIKPAMGISTVSNCPSHLESILNVFPLSMRLTPNSSPTTFPHPLWSNHTSFRFTTQIHQAQSYLGVSVSSVWKSRPSPQPYPMTSSFSSFSPQLTLQRTSSWRPHLKYLLLTPPAIILAFFSLQWSHLKWPFAKDFFIVWSPSEMEALRTGAFTHLQS